MSINLPTTGNLFSNALFFPSASLVQAFNNSGVNTSVTNTQDGGVGVGNQFYGLGSDFLDPQSILENVNSFSNTVSSAITPSSLLPQLVNVNNFSVNDNPTDIDHMTIDQLNTLTSPTFGLNLTPGVNSNPFTWVDPTALDIQLGTLFTSASIQTNQNFIPTATNATLFDVLNAMGMSFFTSNNPDISQVIIGGVPITGFPPGSTVIPLTSPAGNTTSGVASATVNNTNQTSFSGFG